MCKLHGHVPIKCFIVNNWDHFTNVKHAQILEFLKSVCLLFYVLETSMVISGRVLTSDSAHSWWLYRAAALGHQAAGTVTCYPTQSHYPTTEQTSPCPMLIMPSAGLGSDKYQFKGFWFDSTRFRTFRPQTRSWYLQNGRQALYSFGLPTGPVC